MSKTIADILDRLHGRKPAEPSDEEMAEFLDEEPEGMRVIDEFERSFAGVSYPGDGELISNPATWEAPELAAAVRGKHWKDLSLETIARHHQAIPHLTPAAFRFYLPALVIAALVYPQSTNILWEMILGLLAPPAQGNREDRFSRRVAAFNEQQRRAIRAFVKHDAAIEGTSPDPQRERAIGYWS